MLSSLAIVLGVAFIAGTLMVTDGMRAASYAKVGVFDRHTDVAVYLGGQTPIDETTLTRVRAAGGVRAAAGEVTGSGGVLGSNGRPVPGYGVVGSVPVEAALQSLRGSRERGVLTSP